MSYAFAGSFNDKVNTELFAPTPFAKFMLTTTEARYCWLNNTTNVNKF